MSTALIDGDVVLYRAASSVQQKHYLLHCPNGTELRFRYKTDLLAYTSGYEDDEEYFVQEGMEVGSFDGVKDYVEDTMLQIQKETGAEDYKLYVGGKDNFRIKLATLKPYKGQRDKDNRPFYYQQTKDFLVDEWGAVVVDGMEADDAMGIAQCLGDYNKGFQLYPDTVICTIDKDLKMIPGRHFNFVTLEHEVVQPDAALSFFYHQLLIGDSVDNIGGAKGIGKVRAQKILEGLQTEQEMYEACLQAYKGDKDALVENARLLYILREADEKLWEPPLLSCPHCPDQGWWTSHNYYTGDPEQVQCEFCYTEPRSVFNNKEKL